MKKTLPLLALAALAFLPACSSVRTLQVSAEGAMASASFQVDVLPATPAVEAVPVNQYFLPGNTVRASANPRTLRFGAGQPTTQNVSTSGLGGKAVVIAQLPGAHSDASGDADARRKTVPLSGKLPDGSKVTPTLRVIVTQGGITVKPGQ